MQNGQQAAECDTIGKEHTIETERDIRTMAFVLPSTDTLILWSVPIVNAIMRELTEAYASEPLLDYVLSTRSFVALDILTRTTLPIRAYISIRDMFPKDYSNIHWRSMSEWRWRNILPHSTIFNCVIDSEPLRTEHIIDVMSERVLVTPIAADFNIELIDKLYAGREIDVLVVYNDDFHPIVSRKGVVFIRSDASGKEILSAVHRASMVIGPVSPAILLAAWLGKPVYAIHKDDCERYALSRYIDNANDIYPPIVMDIILELILSHIHEKSQAI